MKIDDVFLRIKQQIEVSRDNLKAEVKSLLTQAIQIKLDDLSKATQHSITKLEGNLKQANEEFAKVRAEGKHGILCKQWGKLSELEKTVEKVTKRVAKFGVTKRKDTFFSTEDV